MRSSNLYKIFILNYIMESNNIDNYALYIFLFLSFLSVGNDFYHVYANMLEQDFIKKNIGKMNDYYELFSNVLCNNIEKTKNKIVCNIKEKLDDNKKEENVKKTRKTTKTLKEKKQNVNESKAKINNNENNLLEKKEDESYEENINILKNIIKKDDKKKTRKNVKKEL